MIPVLNTIRVRLAAPLALMLLSAAIAFAAYLQALNYPFISDDDAYITFNTKLTGLSLTELWRLFVEPFNSAYEFLPLRELSFWLDIQLFGLSPAAFRLHNVLLHLLCLPLIYLTTSGVWRYFRPKDAQDAQWAAAAVTALFVLHPSLVESVVWISGRKYVLPNLFGMFALWLTLRAWRAQGFSVPYAAAALAAFVAMMLSKSSYVAVAPIMAMLWVFFWLDVPRSSRRRVQLLWPLAVLFLAGLVMSMFISVANSNASEVSNTGHELVISRSLAILGWMARLAVSVENRHFFYPVFEDPYRPVMVAIGVLVLFAALVGMMSLLRKRSLEGFAIVTFVLLCLPYLQLIPFVSPSLVQDRYLSLAAWPAILLVVVGAWRLKPGPRVAVLLAIALLWTYQTATRSRDWRSLETIVNADTRAYPGYYIPALYKIIDIQLRQGLFRDAIETANAVAIPEIRELASSWVKASYSVHTTAASTGNPQIAMTLLWQMGLELKKQPPLKLKWDLPVNLLWGKGRDELKRNWEYLAKAFPGNESVRYNAGLWLMGENRFADAVPHLLAAVESQRVPIAMRGTAYKNLGLALLNSGQATAAEAPLRAALEQTPPDIRANCALREVYRQSGRYTEAEYADAECGKRR